MDVRTCRGCGRLFNYIGGAPFCPACREEQEKKFTVVKEYIRNNPRATMTQISEENDVSIMQIERWIREERLVFSDDSPIGIDCESCGATIKSGRFCPQCKDNIQRGLGSMYKDKEPEQRMKKPSSPERDRMRFLSK